MKWLGIGGTLAVTGALVYGYPPGGGGWENFWNLSVPLTEKLVFLARVYGLAGFLAFLAVVATQVQWRFTQQGAPSRWMFPVCVMGTLAMIVALRQALIDGAAVAGYALGTGTAYTLMARVYAVDTFRWRGLRLPRVVWRGDGEAVRRMQAKIAELRRGSGAAAALAVLALGLQLSREPAPPPVDACPLDFACEEGSE